MKKRFLILYIFIFFTIPYNVHSDFITDDEKDRIYSSNKEGIKSYVTYQELEYPDGKYFGFYELSERTLQIFGYLKKFKYPPGGVRSGKGIFISNEGLRYEGIWKNGSLKKGKLIGSNSQYIGQLNNGKMEGYGVITYNDGKPEIRGLFKNNKYVGLQKGTEPLESDWAKLCKASKKYTELNLSTETITECDYSLKTGDVRNIPNIYDELKKVKVKIIEGEKKKAEAQKKKAELQTAELKKTEQRKKELEFKINELREIRDPRGKWGIHFNMVPRDIEGCGMTSVCKKDGLIIDNEKIKGVWVVNKIIKDFGKFNSGKFSELVKRLSKKYKLVYEPSKAEKEDFFVSERSIKYLFENKINENEPKYILLSARNTWDRIQSYIKISYLSEHYGYSLIEKKKKKESYLDDL